jgi:hypothetical protein
VNEATVIGLCAGCDREVADLRRVSAAMLCGSCAETSARIDRCLVGVGADDPVACDSCAKSADFDARLAVITRECGGVVLCDRCAPSLGEGARA